MEGRISLCFWSDSKQIFTIFFSPPFIHNPKTLTNTIYPPFIPKLIHTTLIKYDLRRIIKYYHIKQRYPATPESSALLTPPIGRIDPPDRSQHTSRDRIDPPEHTPAAASLHQSRDCIAASALRVYSISPPPLVGD